MGHLVSVHRFRYIWPDSLSIVGHARSMEGDVKMRNLVYPLTPLYLMTALGEFLLLASRWPFDIIHAHWVVPNGPIGAVAARLIRAPLIVSLHGSDVFVMERNRLFAWAGRMASKRAYHVTACSQDLEGRAINLGVAASQISVIPYGVDVNRFRTDRKLGMHVRDMLGIAPNTLVVLGVGRLVYKKGFKYLIRAIPLVVSEFENVLFVIGGEGPLRSQLRQISSELGVENHLLLPGAIPWHEMPSYLSMCDVFVAPSVRDHEGNIDGLPNVVLEAMACGKPIVASAVGGLPEVIRSGDNGLLVEEKKPSQLAEAIKRLLGSPEERTRYGSSSRSKVERALNWDQVGETMVRIYISALGR
jgi:glycosyltransferase involved in cell wall biosynthesis